MPLPPLSPDNDYQLPPSPTPGELDRARFNALLDSIGARLRMLEAAATGLEAIKNDLQQFGLQRLDEAILPLIDQTQQDLANLSAEVAATQAANAQIIDDFQDVVAVNLEDLADQIDAAEAQLAAVQAQIQTYLNGGVPAADVAEDANRVFVTPAQKTEIGQLRTDLTNLSDEHDALALAHQSLKDNLDGGTF